ncbi:MAG: 4Fe-4S dicluster domain-containing protein [Treponema sp.]|nr:4Fe-4S dicluster domain-containing protein [Treponema sp.]
MHNDKDLADQMRSISGAEEKRCMKCGKCSASCPVYESMDIRPHQFASYLREGRVRAMMGSKALWKCLSCYACLERCPRDVKPAKLIEAARLLSVRQLGANYVTPDDIPELVDPDLPQQLLVSVFRKYTK